MTGLHVGREDSVGTKVAGFAAASVRLVMPVLLLMTACVAAFLYSNVAVSWIVGPNEAWLTLGQVLLPLSFLAVHLTNRRYGPGYAFAQVIATWILGGFAFQFVHQQMATLAGIALPSAREAIGFSLGLLLAQLSSVFVFDRTRGPRWWSGPLFASLWGAVVLCLVAYPASYAGTEVDWVNHMFVNLWLAAGAGVLLLIPYWFCRPIVQPLSGFNGY